MEEPTRVDATTESLSVIGPYPWASLQWLARTDVAARRDLLRCMAAEVPLDTWAAAAREILGVPIAVRLDRVAAPTGPFEVEGAFAVLLARSGSSETTRRDEVLIEVEPSLAGALLARTMGRRAPSAVTSGFNAPKAIAGAFAALLVATARRAGYSRALVVRRAGLAASPGRASGHAASPGEASRGWTAASLTVVVAGEAFAARILVGQQVPAMARAAWGARELASLGPMPLTIPIVACFASVPGAELSALALGDVFLPSSWRLMRTSAGALRGTVTLAAPAAPTGVRALFGDDGSLVLSGEIEPVSAAEAEMNDEETAAILSAVGDVPVVVRVEIGEARMSARDWASLRPGDVVTMGRKVGEQVVLRVGGVPVARGQLVDVEGEVGVRIEERLVEERTTA